MTQLNDNKWPLLAALPLALAIAACGSDDDDDNGNQTADAAATGDAASADAPVGENNLGALCGGPQPDCPADEVCVVQPVPMGSGMRGYCSPMCTTDAECTVGYAGEGSPTCFSMNQCTIVCTTIGGTTGECPDGLTCLATGGPTNVCAVQMGGN